MRRLIVICRFGDVLVVRFPFTDLTLAKTRPAVAISSEAFSVDHGQTVMAMITTGTRSAWPTDIPILDIAAAGLQHPSMIRWKLFTLVNEQLGIKIGRLSSADREGLSAASRSVFGF